MSRWGGQLARVLRKTTLVKADRATGRLPVHTLTFAEPPQPLGVRVDMGDIVKIVIPNFKPKSYSVSAQRENEFDVTFKVYPGGRCSGYLDQLEVGDEATVFRMGNKQRQAGRLVGVVAYGVGITEALPVAAAELAKPDATSVCLLWAARTMGDTFWEEKVELLRKEHGTRFQLAKILSRDMCGGALQGRVSPEVLSKVFDGAWGTAAGGPNEAGRADARFLSVGTKQMMYDTDRMFEQIGYPMPRHKLLA